MFTDPFKTQHREALEIAGKIAAEFSGDTIKNPDAARTQLSALIGKLTIHLAMEDKSLYPKAEASSNEDLRKMSIKLKTEMSGLAQAVVAYGQKWGTAAKIAADQKTFITETKGVFDALKKRIDVEERDFYPLIDKSA